MEELSYYFNGDLEQFLSSKETHYKINFNKFNQEFEFLIAILCNEPIYSNRNYSKHYIEYINKLFSINFRTTIKSKEIKLWCTDIYNLELQRKINSRFFTQKIANKFNEYQAIEINASAQLRQGYLYKENYSISGNGNYKYPKDKIKIEKRLKTTNLIEDKFYQRDLDISTLVDGDTVFHYENIVDDHFQYRGSIIGKSLTGYSWFKEYQQKVEKISELISGIEGPYSIDSFIYDNRIYFISEINNRKTMGYISKKIKDIYFSNYSFLQTILIPNRKINNSDVGIENIYLLSPEDNKFGFYIIVSNSLEDLKKKELNLFAKVFD